MSQNQKVTKSRNLFNTNHWSRKNTYEYFKEFELPFFNITANVEVTELFRWCKANEQSFFLASLWYSTKVCNTIENFRLRIEDEEVFLYDKIHLGSTVLFEDKSFGFAYFEMKHDLDSFLIEGQHTLDLLKSKSEFDPNLNQHNLIHYSVIPWVAFTNFQHARRVPVQDSIPKIVFGKVTQINGTYQMPISVEVHHALVDGIHVGKYFEGMANSLGIL